jgi:hypothetical protein
MRSPYFVCVCVSPPINFRVPEPIFMKLGIHDVTCRPIVRKLVNKYVSVEIDSWKLTNYGTHFHGHEWSTNISLDTDTLYKRLFWSQWSQSRVEAASNTSTVTLRVVGDDEKGSFESETVKYGHESHGTRTQKWLCWRGPGANDRPVLSSERTPHINKPATVRQ